MKKKEEIDALNRILNPEPVVKDNKKDNKKDTKKETKKVIL
jgi:hypothetical protein